MSYQSSGIDESMAAAHSRIAELEEAAAAHRRSEKLLCEEIEHVRSQRNKYASELDKLQKSLVQVHQNGDRVCWCCGAKWNPQRPGMEWTEEWHLKPCPIQGLV